MLLANHRGSRAERRHEHSDTSLDIDEISALRGELLSHGWRQRLEMLMVETQEPQVAVLDEPTAGLTKDERGQLAELLLRRKGSATYLVVEHDMDFVEAVADRVSFMHEGHVRVTGSFAEIQSDPTVREIYLGEPIGAARTSKRPTDGV
jgi:urea transport system ATP-binding protein